MNFESKIDIAAHRGLVGTALMRNLCDKGFDNFVTRTHAELNLSNQTTKNRVIANCDQPGSEETARGAPWFMDLNNCVGQVLIQHGGIRVAILFGSLAKGQAIPESVLIWQR